MKKARRRIAVYALTLLLILGATLPGVIDESNRIVFIILVSVFLALWLAMVIVNELRIYRSEQK